MMKQRKQNHEFVTKLVLIALFTALTTVFGFVKIPIMGVTVKMDLPILVIGACILGPLVGAWLTVIPTAITFFTGEAALFMTYSPGGTLLTLFLKGILAGLCAGLVHKALSGKHPFGATVLASIVAPTVNSGVFLVGCYVFIWEELLALAAANGVGIAVLMLGLVIINYILELILCVVVCPILMRVIRTVTKNKYA